MRPEDALGRWMEAAPRGGRDRWQRLRCCGKPPVSVRLKPRGLLEIGMGREAAAEPRAARPRHRGPRCARGTAPGGSLSGPGDALGAPGSRR